MLTLKLQVKENPKDPTNIEVKLIVPKDLGNSTEQEQALAKWTIEKINEIFEKKGN